MIQRIQAVLYMDTRRQTPINSQYGYLGSMFMGIVFSAGWTPCIGPIYGAMLTLASSGESFSKAGVMLTAYALGLGIPFLLTALALDRAQNVFRRLQKNMRMIEIISGVFLLLVGGLILSGQLQRLSTFGGGKSSFGDISANLQDCVVGAFRGEIRPANVPDCIADGVKEDFYIAAAKGTVGQTVPGLNLNPPGPGSPSTGLEIGQRAPNFTAETLDGRTVSLTDYYGQIVLLNFWATWCPACREEMPDFQSVYDLLHTDGFVVLAVDAQEDRATVAQFVDWLGLTFPILLDPTGEVNNVLYGSQTQQGYPASLLIDRDGVIVQHFSGAISGSQLLEALENMLNE
jgi:peroxiredoxin